MAFANYHSCYKDTVLKDFLSYLAVPGPSAIHALSYITMKKEITNGCDQEGWREIGHERDESVLVIGL